MAPKGALKIKKKRWVPIFGPGIFGDQPLGETFIGENNEAQGRSITVSMLQLTHDPKKQAVSATFKINGQKEGGLAAEFTGMSIAPSAMKRMVRRNKEKIDDSFSVITSDGKQVQIKPLIVTRGHITRGTMKDIRMRMRNVIAWEVSKSTYEKLSGDVIDHKLQKQVYTAINAIYPIGVCEIRVFKLLGEAKSKTGPGILLVPVNPPFVPKQKKKEEQADEKPEEAPEVQADEKPAESKEETPAEEKPKKKAKKKEE